MGGWADWFRAELFLLSGVGMLSCKLGLTGLEFHACLHLANYKCVVFVVFFSRESGWTRGEN